MKFGNEENLKSDGHRPPLHLKNLLQQLPLRPRHFSGQFGCGVIVTDKMQYSMQRVEQDFLLDVEPMNRRLVPRHGRANENLAVGKRDHVGLGRITEEIAMDAGHGGAINQDDFDAFEMLR